MINGMHQPYSGPPYLCQCGVSFVEPLRTRKMVDVQIHGFFGGAHPTLQNQPDLLPQERKFPPFAAPVSTTLDMGQV